MNNSGTGSHATGSLVMHIAWPKTSARLIPAATGTLQFIIAYPSGGADIVNTTYGAGVPTVIIGNLPVGNLLLTVSALDGNGKVIASGTTSFTTIANQDVTVSLSLASTIDRLVVLPFNPVVTVDDTIRLA